MPRDAPPAGVGQSLDFHNGRKMQDSLPLWQEADKSGCRKERATGAAAKERRSGTIWNDGTSSVIPPEGPPTAASR